MYTRCVRDAYIKTCRFSLHTTPFCIFWFSSVCYKGLFATVMYTSTTVYQTYTYTTYHFKNSLLCYRNNAISSQDSTRDACCTGRCTCLYMQASSCIHAMSLRKRKQGHYVGPMNIAYARLITVHTDLTDRERSEPLLETFSRIPPSYLFPSIETQPTHIQAQLLNYVFFKFRVDPGDRYATGLVALNRPYATDIYYRNSAFNLSTFFRADCMRGFDCMYWGGWYNHTIMRIQVHFFISPTSMMCFIGTYDRTNLREGEFKYEDIARHLAARQHDFRVLYDLFFDHGFEELAGLVAHVLEVDKLQDMKRLRDSDIDNFIAYLENHVTNYAMTPGNEFYVEGLCHIWTRASRDAFTHFMKTLCHA